MLFKDIDIFVTAAQAILQGRNPYLLPNVEVFYPLPFYFLFIPFVGLPLPLVHVLWIGLQSAILVLILRRRALIVILSVPVLLIFILGQVDILTLGMFSLLRADLAGGIALAFLCLKPQLVLILAPWMVWRWFRYDRHQLVWFLAVLGSIVLISLLVQPDWPLSLLARSGERFRSAKSSSIWGLLSFLPGPLWLASVTILVLIFVIYAIRSHNIDIVTNVGLLVSPFIFSYNLLPLILLVKSSRLLLGFSLLSWIAFGIAAYESNDRASGLLSLAVLVLLILQKGIHPSMRFPRAMAVNRPEVDGVN